MRTVEPPQRARASFARLPSPPRCSTTPTPVIAYRIDYAGRSVVYATDTEHVEGRVDAPRRALPRGRPGIYDAQYTPEEYRGEVGPSKRGWGHSTYEAGVDVARAASVKTLALFHHEGGVARNRDVNSCPSRATWGTPVAPRKHHQKGPRVAAPSRVCGERLGSTPRLTTQAALSADAPSAASRRSARGTMTVIPRALHRARTVRPRSEVQADLSLRADRERVGRDVEHGVRRGGRRGIDRAAGDAPLALDVAEADAPRDAEGEDREGENSAPTKSSP
ncbi:MAG: hypothetical protein IPM79_16010 [Polyangiaceae bacterium]|nr:hypothetical protein [Polyangiaceae bacterium]